MNIRLKILLLIAGAALAMAGCNREPSVASAAKDLEKSFQTQPTQPVKPTSPVGAATVERDDTKNAVGKAVIAMKTNGYAEAFFTLRSIQASPNLTLDQYTAIQNARLAVERNLAEKAVAGDPAARKALEEIQKAH
jgi:hypothetical protein